MDHLDEVAGAVGAAVQVALLGSAIEFLAAGRARNIAGTRSESRENRIEVLDDLFLAADHHAVAALQTPHAAAGAYVNIVNLSAERVPSRA